MQANKTDARDAFGLVYECRLAVAHTKADL